MWPQNLSPQVSLLPFKVVMYKPLLAAPWGGTSLNISLLATAALKNLSVSAEHPQPADTESEDFPKSCWGGLIIKNQFEIFHPSLLPPAEKQPESAQCHLLVKIHTDAVYFLFPFCSQRNLWGFVIRINIFEGICLNT